MGCQAAPAEHGPASGPAARQSRGRTRRQVGPLRAVVRGRARVRLRHRTGAGTAALLARSRAPRVMTHASPILLADDNPTDAELTIRALEIGGVSNPIVWVQDGEAALDFVFRRGQYAQRS